MTSVVLDANVVIDILVDRPVARTYEPLMAAIRTGQTRAVIPLPAFLETDWMLQSRYKQTKTSCINGLRAACELTDPANPTTQLVLQALVLYEYASGVNLADCLIVLAAIQDKADEFITGDKKLARLYRSLKNKKGRR